MKDLLAFYTRAVLTMAGAIVAVALLEPGLMDWFNGRFGKKSWQAMAAGWLMSRPALVGLTALLEYALRKWLWKLFRRTYDFSGIWSGTTRYTHVHVGIGDVPREERHEVTILQDCLSISIVPSAGETIVVWKSTAVNLMEGGEGLVYAYKAEYRAEEGFPEGTHGYEEMSVVERGFLGRPVRMRGKFYHCAQGQRPVYSGEVEFNRS